MRIKKVTIDSVIPVGNRILVRLPKKISENTIVADVVLVGNGNLLKELEINILSKVMFRAWEGQVIDIGKDEQYRIIYVSTDSDNELLAIVTGN